MHKYPFRTGACQASSLWKVTVGPAEREGLRMAYKCAARRRFGFAPAVVKVLCNLCAAEGDNIMLQLLARARERLSGAIPPLDAGRTHPPSNGPKQPPF